MGSKILNVPYKCQNDADANLKHTDCGPCCIAMILGSLGQTMTTNAIVAAAGMTGDSGLSQSQVASAASAFGLSMTWQAAYTLDDLKKVIDNGQPPIALIKYANIPDRVDQRSTGGHFVVVVGYDDASGRVFINDPDYFPGTAGGYQKPYSYQTWLSAWGGFAAGENLNFCLIVPQPPQPVNGEAIAATSTQTAAPAGNVWVIAPAGLLFRDQPSTSGNTMGGLVFGQQLAALGSESSPADGTGRTWQQVRTDAGVTGYVATSLNGDRLLSNQKPADPYIVSVIDNQAIRDAGGLAVRDQRNVMLDSIDRVQANENMTVFGRAVESDGTPWLWVQSPRNQYGWAREQSQGVTLVSRVTPDMSGNVSGATPEPVRNKPAPVATSADVWVTSDNGLNVRAQSNPTANLIVTVMKGAHLTVIGPQVGPDSNGITWQQTRTDDGRTGWIAVNINGQATVDTTQPVTPVITSVVPWGKCYTGLGMGNPQPLTPTELNVIRKSNIEAFKTLTLPDPGENQRLIQQLQQIRSDMFIAARLFFSVDANSKARFNPRSFVDFVNNGIDACYQAGVRYFEVHNEPNLPQEGMGWNWADGSEFGAWLIGVLSILRQRYPEGKFGFPGLSPQPNVPAFLQGAASAIAQCDWIGIHAYWQSETQPPYPMNGDNAGTYWRQFRTQFPDKLLMITEFSCNTPNVDAAAKGQMYARYYQTLRQEPNLGAAFSFALNWPGQDQNREGWVFNGQETAIVNAAGSAISQPGFLA
ncbi:MAG TPA: C39 family peptidase [Anaerolineae bacterium]